MLCDICKKNEATVHIEEFSSDGHNRTIHLCSDCMAKNPQFGGVDVTKINLAEVIYNLTEKIKGSIAKPTPKREPIPSRPTLCPNCGWSSDKLHKTGRLGCPVCYSSFSAQLIPILEDMHQGAPRLYEDFGTTASDEYIIELRELEQELAHAVEIEEYEEAAKLRDQIIALKESFNTKTSKEDNGD